jgi:hypothetical protein
MKTLRAWERSKHTLLSVIVLPLAFACGKSESFKALEETKALLSQTDSKAPLLTHPSEKQKLLTEETLILDFNNEKTGNDEEMSYSCFYDQVIDGTVAESTSCDSLPGGAAQKLDPATGKFVWGPLENTSSYELRFIGKNKVGSDSLILTVEVLQNRKPKLDPINDIGIPALKTVSVVPVNKRDPGTATVTYSCRFDKVVDEKISDSVECKNLPGEPAIKFDATSGTLSWIPPESAVGSYEFEIKAENSFGSDLKIFSINVGVSEVKKITLSFIRDQSLVVGDTLSLDVNNTITNSDDGVTYTCHYDSLADGVVNELLSCDLLPGTPTQKFNPLTGALNWTPSLTGNTELEIKIKGTKQGDSDTQVFVVSLATQRFGDVGNSAIVFDPTSWDFGSLALNNTSAAKSITITNNASADVYIGSFTATLSDFIINWNSCPVPPQKLASLASCILNISFRPTTSGSLGGSIVVRFGKTPAATSDYNSVLGLSGRGVGSLVFAGLDSISNVTHNSLRLNWTANAAAASFLIFKVNGTSLEYLETLVNTNGTVNSKTLTALTPSTSYTFRVRATDYVGVVDSNTVNRTATTLSNTAPSVSAGPSGWQVFSGRTITALDFNDTVSSNDYDPDGDPITYSCYYDNVINGTVAEDSTKTCGSLSNINGGNPTFSQYTGIFSGWKPSIADENIDFEFRVKGIDAYGGTSSVYFSTTVNSGYPTITNITDKVFPSTHLVAGNTFSQNFDNIRFSPAGDADMTYTCTFKRLTTSDSASNPCANNLPGTFSMSSSTGEFSWLPGTAGVGAYEITVTGTNLVSSSSRTFKVSVMPDIDDTQRLFHVDARFADQKRGGRNSLGATTTTWYDLTNSGDTGTLSGFNSAAAWTGSSSASDPMALLFDGADDTVNFTGVDFPTTNALHFDTWIYEGVNSQEKVIFSHGDSSERGMILTNRRFWLGNGTNTAYRTTVLADNPLFYWRLDSNATISNETAAGATYAGLIPSGNVAAQDDAVFNITGGSVRTSTTGHIKPATAPLAGDNWTIEAWFQFPFTTGCSTGYCALVKTNPYTASGVTYNDYFVAVERGTLNFGIYKNTSPTNTPANAFYSSGYSAQTLNRGWHHLAVVGSGGNSVRFYVDGVAVGTPITSYFPKGNICNIGGSGTTSATCGTNSGTSTHPFGAFDEFAFYSSALSAATIESHFNAGYKSYCTYAMNDGYWFHLAGYMDDITHTGKLFINGSEACSFSKPSGKLLAGSGNPIRFGSSSLLATNSYWAGKISSFLLYDNASSSNIASNYTATSSLYSPKLAIPPAGLRFWVRSDLGLYTTSDKDVAVANDGDPVAVWEDQSGSGGDLSVRTQLSTAATTARPTWNATAVGGKPAVSFDGVDDNLQNIVNYGYPNTVFIVGRYNGTTPRGRVLSGTNNNWLMGWHSGFLDRFFPGAWVLQSNVSATTSWQIYATDHSSSIQRVFRNNSLVSSGAVTGTQGPSGLTLGSNGNNSTTALSEPSISQIAEIIVYSRVLSDSERQAIFSYLNARYGVY